MIKRKSKLNKVLIIKLTAALILIAAVVILSLFPGWLKIYELAGIYPDRGVGLSVFFADAGQADAAFITDGKYNMLIDAGADFNCEKLSQLLNRYNVKKLDLVIATHPDTDHIGGMNYIVNNYNIGEFYLPKIKRKYIGNIYNYNKLINSLKENSHKINYISSPVKISYPFNMEILSPDIEYDNANDYSIVTRLTYGDVKYLFMGDASVKVENNLLNSGVDLSADVLKVSHHGSRTASSKRFLKAVKPAVSLVSVGDNTFNLPNVQIINRLNKYSKLLLRTDLMGTVTVSTDGKEITYHTEKGLTSK